MFRYDVQIKFLVIIEIFALASSKNIDYIYPEPDYEIEANFEFYPNISLIECDEKTKEIIAEEMQTLLSNLAQEFVVLSADFSEDIQKEVNESINLLHVPKPVYKLTKQELETQELIMMQLPLFANVFFENSSVSLRRKWQYLKPGLKRIIDVFNNSALKSENIFKEYNADVSIMVKSFKTNMNSFTNELASMKNVLKLINSSLTKLEEKTACNNNTFRKNWKGIKSEETQTFFPSHLPIDCSDALQDFKQDGVIVIQSNPSIPHQKVWCNNSLDGGGWTVILRRSPQPIHLDFRRSLSEYEKGFGDPEGEYWIGLKALHHITTKQQNELYVEVGIPGEKAFARYRKFKVNEPDGYKLLVSGYDEFSTAGNSLAYHDKMLFSTFDYDRDEDPVRSCSAQAGGGGFWFNFCYHANPTGVYPPKGLPKDTALHSMIEWRRWKGFHTFLSHLTMMIRPIKV